MGCTEHWQMGRLGEDKWKRQEQSALVVVVCWWCSLRKEEMGRLMCSRAMRRVP